VLRSGDDRVVMRADDRQQRYGYPAEGSPGREHAQGPGRQAIP
jgi:hypothetical protein